MQGLELAKLYYDTYGAPTIREQFPEWEHLIAFGLSGSGSECYGFDDELSKDHDFEPGFCLWIPEENEINSKTAFRMERMYARLPMEFMGYKRSVLQPAGGHRHGVFRYSEFLERHIGKKDTDFTLADWFNIPECSLSEVTNGQIWRDDCGRWSSIRHRIQEMPEDVRLKKMAGGLYLMGQSGPYNYERCIAHGETGAAQLALAEFTKQTIHVAFLLNRTYMPYYKWSFRALRHLPRLASLGDRLEFLLTTDNDKNMIEQKTITLKQCVSLIIDALQNDDLTIQSSADLGIHAETVNQKIRDSYIRSADILSGT